MLQFNILFPGETLFRGNNPRAAYDILPGDPSPKDSVWALYARSQLLFVSAVHIKYSDRLTEQAKAEFAVRAWLETERIEAQLDLHTCDVEKATSECCCKSPSFCIWALNYYDCLHSLSWPRVFIQHPKSGIVAIYVARAAPISVRVFALMRVEGFEH